MMNDLVKLAKAQMIQCEALTKHYKYSMNNFFGFGVPVVINTWERYWKGKRMEQKAGNPL
jgi:hypothetical protein